MRHLALALACVLGSCTQPLPPTGQIVLLVDTDAPVPSARDAPVALTRLSPLVDRARIEVLVDGKPLAGSSRDFALDEELLRDQKLSFGVVPAPHDDAVAVRVRLFRADRVHADEPAPGTTLDTVVTLPPVPTEGITEVSVVLRVDDFGRRVGPLPASPGRPATSSVGTWRGGHHAPCGGAPAADEVCVPGGSFFLGDPQFRGRTFANDIVQERLAWVSPFYLGRTEVTVAAFRARWPELAAAGVSPPLSLYGPRNSGKLDDYCTWTEQPSVVDGVALDLLPLACVSWETARAYCRAAGADLPSEAQYEYVTSGLGEERAFVWGVDEPSCTAAVWGRGGAGALSDGSPVCRQPGTPGWLAFPGSGERDRIDTNPEVSGGAEIVDLGGNLAEWALDMWSQPSDPFWSAVVPMIDPLASGADPALRPIRGGSWVFTALTTRAAFRVRRMATEQLAHVGFRCARAAAGARQQP